jgi:hypothetical protein
MATTPSPPLQLATAFRPVASGGGGLGNLGGVAGAGVVAGRGRARRVASDRDAQGSVTSEEGTRPRPATDSYVSSACWSQCGSNCCSCDAGV